MNDTQKRREDHSCENEKGVSLKKNMQHQIETPESFFFSLLKENVTNETNGMADCS